MAEETKYPRYRWVVLAIAWFCFMTTLWSWYVIPGRVHDLMPSLALTESQFSMLLTAPTLAAVFSCIPGGLLADRYGVRWVVGAGTMLAGIAGIGRVFCTSFGPQFAMMFLIGIGIGFVMPNVPKIVGVWFSPSESGRAVGIVMSGMSAGLAIGVGTAAIFSSWQQAFLITGVITLVMAGLWLALVRSAPTPITATAQSAHAAPVSIGESLRHSVKQKSIWLLSAAEFLFYIAFVGVTGTLPHMLETVHGVSPEVAGAASSAVLFAGIAGMIIGPMISDRIGLRKPVIGISMAAAAILIFFGWFTAMSIATWVLIIVGGLVLAFGLPLLLTLPLELPEFGQRYAGGATGIMLALGNLGGFISAPYIFVPVAQAAGPTIAYLACLVPTACIGALLIPITETGRKAKRAASH